MDSRSILSINVLITVATVSNFDGNFDGDFDGYSAGGDVTCKLIFKPFKCKTRRIGS